jgi:hypothetical protein
MRVTDYTFSGVDVPFQLPCPVLTQLQELTAHRCQLLEPGGSSVSADTAHQQQRQQQHLTAVQHPSFLSSSNGSTRSVQPSLACLTRLTSLSLKDINYGLSDGLAGLSALTGLQQLQLGPVCLPYPAPLQEQQDETQRALLAQERWNQREKCQIQLWHNAVNSLYQLSQLTQLELHQPQLPPSTPSLFAHMQQLQELGLLWAPAMCTDVLDNLPASITKLELAWRGSQLSSSTVPALAGLTSLQRLVLDAHGSAGFQPTLISSMQLLRVLTLEGAMVSDIQQHDDQAAAAAGAPLCGLLDVLPQLSKLETLAIISTSEDEVQPLPARYTAKYAALLSASAHLTQLQLCWDYRSWLLPYGCWQHVFAAGMELPQLKELWVGIPKSVLEFHCSSDTSRLAERMAATAPCFGPGDVGRLVQCCPALEYLSIPGMTPDGVDISPLTALTALTGLCVAGEAVRDDAISAALAPLTRLQQLQIYQAPHMTDQGLHALAAFRQLTYLGACECGISKALWDEDFARSVFCASQVRSCHALLTVSGYSYILGAMTELQRSHVE